MLSIDIPLIHVCEGQHPVLVFMPMIAALLIGTAYLHKNWDIPRPGKSNRVLAAISGLLCLGSAAMTLYQTIRALTITGFESHAVIALFLIFFPALGGYFLLRSSQAEHFGIKARIKAAFGGILGFSFWAGQSN